MLGFIYLNWTCWTVWCVFLAMHLLTLGGLSVKSLFFLTLFLGSQAWFDVPKVYLTPIPRGNWKALCARKGPMTPSYPAYVMFQPFSLAKDTDYWCQIQAASKKSSFALCLQRNQLFSPQTLLMWLSQSAVPQCFLFPHHHQNLYCITMLYLHSYVTATVLCPLLLLFSVLSIVYCCLLSCTKPNYHITLLCGNKQFSILCLVIMSFSLNSSKLNSLSLSYNSNQLHQVVWCQILRLREPVA